MTPPDDWNPVAAILACRVAPFSGAAWRAHNAKYDATSAEGSRRTTGRYNCGPDRFPDGPNWPVLYLALAPEVCIGELVRNIAPLSPARLNSYRITELRMDLSIVVDCTDLGALRLDMQDLCHDRDWEIPQELAEVALHARYEGMIVPSASRLGNNLILFPEQLRAGSTIEIAGHVDPRLFRGST
jgi:RES domain-containing protein